MTCICVRPSACSECYQEKQSGVVKFLVQSYLVWSLAIVASFIPNKRARRLVLKARKRVGRWGITR